jgi:sugar/nucleoside kinase (ribokinase family)
MKVMGLGHAAWDTLLVIPEPPRSNAKMVAAVSLEQGGGPVATACVTLRRLGTSAALAAVVGTDTVGDKLVAELEQEGVDTAWILRDPDVRTPRAYILVEKENGKRLVVLDRTRARQLRPEEVRRLPLDDVRWLLLDGKDGEAALLAARMVRERGGKVMLDLGGSRTHSEELLAACDYCVVSRDFIAAFLPEMEYFQAAAELVSRGPELAVITLGAGGSVCSRRGKTTWIPTPAVEEIVDTTGAGDVFHGALLHALVRGWEEEPALRFASAAAALSCRALGGRSAIPGEEEVLKMMR